MNSSVPGLGNITVALPYAVILEYACVGELEDYKARERLRNKDDCYNKK